MYLSKSAILQSDDLKQEDVDCPEWGGTVRVRELTSRERDKHEADLVFGSQKEGEERDRFLENLNARIAAAGAIDEQGLRLFETPEDMAALGEKSATAVARVAEKIAELSGMSPAAKKDAEGNSEAAPSGGGESE